MGVTPNGDLWSTFQRQLQIRGGGVAAITKIKAHTELEDIAKGIISERDRDGNAIADDLARRGVGSHIPGLADFSYAFGCRVKLYISLLNHIHAMIARVFKAAQQHREQTKKRAWATGIQVSHRDAVQPMLPIVPHNIEFRRQLVLSIPHRALVQQGGIAFNHVWHFLRLLTVSPVVHPDQGISWLELLCLFHLVGGVLYESPPDSNPATTKPLLRAKLALFKRTCKHVVSTCLATCDRLLFSPSTRPDLRLATMGYSNFFSCIQMHVHRNSYCEERVLIGLFTLRSKLTQRKSEALSAGNLHVPVVKVRLKGVAPWEALDGVCTDIPYSVAELADSSTQDASSSLASEPSRVLHMECSRCSAIKSNTNTPLYANGAFRSVFCQGCKRSTNAKLWLCLCGHPWFRCTRHSAIGFSILRAHNPGTIRSASDASLLVPEAGVGVPVRKARRRCIPDDRDSSSTFVAQHPTRKRGRTPSALDAVDRIRQARANPFGGTSCASRGVSRY